MSLRYKENNFSAESLLVSETKVKNKITRPNIDHLIKRIMVEKRRERKKTLTLVFTSLSIIVCLIFYTTYN